MTWHNMEKCGMAWHWCCVDDRYGNHDHADERANNRAINSLMSMMRAAMAKPMTMMVMVLFLTEMTIMIMKMVVTKVSKILAQPPTRGAPQITM